MELHSHRHHGAHFGSRCLISASSHQAAELASSRVFTAAVEVIVRLLQFIE